MLDCFPPKIKAMHTLPQDFPLVGEKTNKQHCLEEGEFASEQTPFFPCSKFHQTWIRKRQRLPSWSQMLIIILFNPETILTSEAQNLRQKWEQEELEHVSVMNVEFNISGMLECSET